MTDGDVGNGELEDGATRLPLGSDEADAPRVEGNDLAGDIDDDTVELEELSTVPPWLKNETDEVVWEQVGETLDGEGNSTEELPEAVAEEVPASRLSLVEPVRPAEPAPSAEPEPTHQRGDESRSEQEPAAGPATQPDPSESDHDLWHDAPSVLDDFTSDDYLSATTMEYQDLAAAVLQSETEVHELHAVSATMPGMDSGVVGFEDVTGAKTAEPVETGPGDLPSRIITGVVLASLFIGALLAGGGWLMLLVAVIAVLSLGEFYAAARRVGYVPVAAFGLAGTIGTIAGGWFGGPGGIAGAIALVTMLVLLWYSVLVRRDPLENAAVTIFGLVWVGGLLGFAAPIAKHPDYLPLLITLVLTAAFMDIGSYFIGRSIGKRKLAPVLSPKKTVEGLLGGMAVAFGVAVFASLIFEEITFVGALWLALGVSVLAPMGDMAESMVKRSFGIKDMGSILPGHGGFLDRIDALLFVVPISYYVYLALGYLD